MKKYIFGFLIFAFVVFVFLPKRRLLLSPTGNGKCITIYRGFSIAGDVYVVPGKHNGYLPPSTNFIKLSPMYDQVLTVNWEPNDSHELKIELPLCDQPFVDRLDSTRYKVFIACGLPRYFDLGEHYHFPKYESYSDWLP